MGRYTVRRLRRKPVPPRAQGRGHRRGHRSDGVHASSTSPNASTGRRSHGGRALANAFTDRWAAHPDVLSESLDDDLTAQIKQARVDADLSLAPVYAGESAGLVDRTHRRRGPCRLRAVPDHLRARRNAGPDRWPSGSGCSPRSVPRWYDDGAAARRSRPQGMDRPGDRRYAGAFVFIGVTLRRGPGRHHLRDLGRHRRRAHRDSRHGALR